MIRKVSNSSSFHFRGQTKNIELVLATIRYLFKLMINCYSFFYLRCCRHFWHNDSFQWKLHWYSTNPWSSKDRKQSQNNCCNKWRQFWGFPRNFRSVSGKFSFHYLFLWKQYQGLLKFKQWFHFCYNSQKLTRLG